MISPLERGRVYRFGVPEQAVEMIYVGRDFPPSSPAVFTFEDREGIIYQFTLGMLTEYERQGKLEPGEKGLTWDTISEQG